MLHSSRKMKADACQELTRLIQIILANHQFLKTATVSPIAQKANANIIMIYGRLI